MKARTLNKPRFKPSFSVQCLAPDLVFLLSERERHTLTGNLYFSLAPLLDGHHDIATITERLSAIASPMQISYALHRLQNKGYVSDFDTPSAVQSGLIRLHVVGNVDVRPLFTALTALNLLADDDADADLDLVVIDDELHNDLDSFNRSAKRAWMLVKPMNSILWIGPVFVPGETACWSCLARRTRDNHPIETFLETQIGKHLVIPHDAPISVAALGMSLAAHEAIRWLSGERHLRSQLYAFDTITLKGAFHNVVRYPTCSVCGTGQKRAATAIQLQSRPQAGATDAGSRSATAATTLARYDHHISPITGIVTHLTRVATPEHIHLYASGHNKARPLHQWGKFKRHLRAQSAGKGTDPIQARASALCEAIERYSGMVHGDEPTVTARQRDLEGAIHPHDLLLFSEAQYATRDTWNTHSPPHLFVPQPFEDERPIEWSPVWSLRDHNWKYVPTAYGYYDAPQASDHLFCSADSNGCAAGSSPEDAILQALLEVIERDAIAIWWDNELCRPAFDLDTLNHPYIERTRTYFAQTGRDFWLLDITTDLNVPVFVALSRRIDAPTEDIVLGFGAHLDSRIAALRALTEMNQSLPAALRDANGDYQSDSEWELHWWRTATIQNQPYLAPDPTLSMRTPFDYPFIANIDLRDDILYLVDLARVRGIDTLILDQTRADAGLPVVRAIMPGMRHFWGRHAAGRLYDIPVQMGWLALARHESELNATPMFM